MCACPVMFEVQQQAADATGHDASALTTLASCAQHHRKCVATNIAVAMPINAVPSAGYRHPYGGVVPTSIDPLGEAPDVVGIFTRADVDDQLSEIVCTLPRRPFETTKSSDDWLAWTVPGKHRKAYAADPALPWAKHGVLGNLTAALETLL